jgi:hypothetical protein
LEDILCQNKQYLAMSDADPKAQKISQDQSPADENYESNIDQNSMLGPHRGQFATESAGHTSHVKSQVFGRQKTDHNELVYQKVSERKNQHKAIHLTPWDLSGRKGSKGIEV